MRADRDRQTPLYPVKSWTNGLRETNEFTQDGVIGCVWSSYQGKFGQCF